ncbi:unnamed protein product [Blepharisma stoltei]|uniref:Calmodulin n=1 Tax=Blepharisma stoltei TaxID=1481888 RepID=A0AAU9JV71_9CILI|nr:unnamed protein product [Blepharisma stoltei]
MLFESYEELEECFTLFDRNHNGYLDIQELSNALRAMGLDKSQSQVEKLLQSVDLHHRNEINIEEFSRLCGVTKPRPKITKQQLMRRIAKFDKDKNGFIEAGELRNLLRFNGDSVDEEHVEKILKDFDTNGDGKLSIEELAVGLLRRVNNN